MVGGPKAAVARLTPILDALALGVGEIARTPWRVGRDPWAGRGYIHARPSGARHFFKMIHNSLEYVLMRAYAEGFDILKSRASAELPEEEGYRLDLAEVWRRGSVVSFDLGKGAR